MGNDEGGFRPFARFLRRSGLGFGLGAEHKPRRRFDVEAGGVMDCVLYQNGRRTSGSLQVPDALEAARRSNGFVWVRLYESSEETLARVADEFSLHALAVEDAIHAHQRPKVDVYGDHAFVVLKTIRYIDSKEVIQAGDVMLFLGPHFVISVGSGVGGDLTTIRDHLETRPDLLRAGPSGVLYAVADHTVDDYGLAVAGLATDVDEVETSVFDPSVAGPTERIYKLKREVMEFRRAVDPLSEALTFLSNDPAPFIEQSLDPYFRDVLDHVARVGERIASFNQMLSDVLQANVAQVTLRQNEDVRRITAVAAILATLTTIAGIYGMNFEHMPELGWRHGYFIVLGVMALASLALYVTFRRKKWL